MENVIPFPASHSKPAISDAPPDAGARERFTEAYRAERTRQIEIAIQRQGAKLNSSDETLRVAHALYQLLDRLEKEHSINKATVLLEAGIGSEGDSTKHLSQYAIPPGRSDSKGRLRKKVSSYAKIVTAAVELAHLDKGAALLEVFGEATFWKLPGARGAPAEFAELAEKLHFIMGAVARKHNLTAFLRNVERAGVAPAPSLECERKQNQTDRPFQPDEIVVAFEFDGPQNWPIEFDQPSWEGETEEGDRLPAYPSLVLGAWWLGDPFPLSVTVETTDTDGTVLLASGTVQGRDTVELRLCIAPIGSDREATPALRVHLGTALSPLLRKEIDSCVSEAAIDNMVPIVTFPGAGWCPLKRGRSIISGYNPSTGQNVACEIDVENGAIPELRKKYFDDLDTLITDNTYSSPGLRFLPVTGAICEDWFGFRIEENQYDTMRLRLAERALGYSLAEPLYFGFPFSSFRKGTLAERIDQFLCDTSHGLDMLFDRQAERLRRAFDEGRSRDLTQRREEWGRVRERWTEFSSKPED